MVDAASDIQARLAQLGIRLPAPPQPVASYVPYTLHAGLLFVSGQGPLDADGTMHTGLVGRASASNRRATMHGSRRSTCSRR